MTAIGRLGMMANSNQPHENLLRDATKYPCRLSLRISAGTEGGEAVELFAGIRANGAWAVYFGEDPAMQFDESGKLRRLYWNGRKFAASHARLIEVTRTALGGRVRMRHESLNIEAEQALLMQCRAKLAMLKSCMENENFELVGVLPESDSSVLRRVMELIEAANSDCSVAQDC